MLKFICILALFFIAQQAHGSQHFSCGESDVKISAVRVSHYRGDVSGIIMVRVGGREVSRRYDAGWYVGGLCSRSEGSHPIVIYKAYCPGCHDGYGWGMIDATTLRILLIPDDTNHNRVKAQNLYGKQPLPHVPMMNISEENIDNDGD